MTDDEKRIRELHDAFCQANTTGDVAFLRAHMAPGADALTWFNLNQSNYVGVDHICELWEMLRAAMGGKEAQCEAFDERVTVDGNMAVVTYLLHFGADFGALGKFVQDARDTEVWQKQNGEWKMIHFHCSNYVPGVMGGK